MVNDVGYFRAEMVKLLLVEIRLFYRIMKKSFQGPMHGRLRCGKMVYLHGRLPMGPISVHPAMENQGQK